MPFNEMYSSEEVLLHPSFSPHSIFFQGRLVGRRSTQKSTLNRSLPSAAYGPYLALLPVQVKLVLTDGHSPDGLYQGRTGVPSVHSNSTMSESPPGHRCPRRTGEEQSQRRKGPMRLSYGRTAFPKLSVLAALYGEGVGFV